MKLNYFKYNNKKYYTGTEIKITSVFSANKQVYDSAYFIYHDVDKNLYVYELNRKRCFCPSKIFWNEFKGVGDKVNNSIKMPEKKQLKDSQIKGLWIGWMWYLLIMIVSIIFNDALIIWTVSSVVFFRWRKAKIEKEGYYVEW